MFTHKIPLRIFFTVNLKSAAATSKTNRTLSGLAAFQVSPLKTKTSSFTATSKQLKEFQPSLNWNTQSRYERDLNGNRSTKAQRLSMWFADPLAGEMCPVSGLELASCLHLSTKCTMSLFISKTRQLSPKVYSLRFHSISLMLILSTQSRKLQ